MEPLGTVGSNNKFKPFSYMNLPSIVEQLERILSRVDNRCDEWKSRDLPNGVMGDVYEGRVWKEWLPWLGRNNGGRSLAFALNCDWFQPYKYSQHSAGAVYMVILNLPREIRYKSENVILVGMLPRTSEHTISTIAFTEPIVDELLQLWEGVDINGKNTQGALLCVTCDLPAGRSFCGFTACTAIAGCTRCECDIHKNLAGPNRSGPEAKTSFFRDAGAQLDQEKSPKRRDPDTHRRKAEDWQNSRTQSERKTKEFQSGCRWSPLLRLPYFNAPRFNVIDGMHCFFLGLVKHTLEIFIDKKYFSTRRFAEVVSRLEVPRGKLGRMMAGYEDKIRKMTAEEYMTFALYFSDEVFTILLQDDPPIHLENAEKAAATARRPLKDSNRWNTETRRKKEEAHAANLERKNAAVQELQQMMPEQANALCMWRHLSEALRGASANVVPATSIPLIQDHLWIFLTKFEDQFGLRACKPNQHFAQELVRENLLDYGPLHVFWCFAFERLNGILGEQPHNFRNLQRILPGRFMNLQDNLRARYSFLRAPSFTWMWDNLQPVEGAKSVLINREHIRNTTPGVTFSFLEEQGKVVDIFGPNHIFWKDVPVCLVENVHSRHPRIRHIVEVGLLSERFAEMTVRPKSMYLHSAARICLYDDTIGSANSSSRRSSFILSKFQNEADTGWTEWAGQVQHFYEVSFADVDGKEADQTKLMAFVLWYKRAPNRDKPPVRKSETPLKRPFYKVFQNKFEQKDRYCWISVTEIAASFVPCYIQDGNRNYFFACRVPLKSFH